MINKICHAKKYIALILSLVLCLGFMMPGEVFASKTGEGGIDFITEVVNIDSAEDFNDFAEACRSQNYSLAKTFILGADIDLSDYPDLTVPYLDGVFDGQGHTISGINIDENISDCGLFRYVGVSGAVYDLTVSGNVVFGDDQKNSGILAGTNKGLITRCTTRGSLNARSQVGGIAGLNEKSGVIKNCVNEAVINGKYQTGGIVGSNEGRVIDCMNKGDVNTYSRIMSSMKAGDSDTVNISIPNAVTGFAADERANETGGIAGCSEGDLIYCENEGQIGCKELGTATGGVAGRLYGCVTGCENHGRIMGRKNVGGIVGFLDPFKVVSLDRDYYDEIRDEFDRVDESLDDMSDSGEKFGDDLYYNLVDISDRVKDLRNVVRTYVDEYDADVRSTRQSIGVQADEIEAVIDDMDYKFRLKKIIKYEKELMEDIEQIIELTDRLEKLIPTLDEEKAEALIATVRQYEEMIGRLKSIADQLEEIRKALEEGDFEGRSISDNSVPDLPSIDPVELPDHDFESDKALSEELSDLLMNYKEAAETIERIKFFYRDAFAQLDAISDVMKKWPKIFKKIKKNLRTISDDAQVIRDISDQMMDRMEYRTDAMKIDVRTRSDDITDRVDMTRDTLYDDWEQFSDDLDRVRGNFDSLRTTLKDGRDEIKKIIEDKSVYVDVSDDANADVADGKILYCTNSGEVTADNMAGGVVGCIDIVEIKDTAVDIFERYRYYEGDRVDEEEEDDEEEEEKDSFIHHVRALVHECKNSADVSCDEGYAGGIAGRAKYGVISGCESYADINAGDGKYAGGVAGYSKLTVSGCYVFGGVSASSYVGGIAGSGNNIYDTKSCAYMDMEEPVVKATGAVAGKSTGEVALNFFVDNGFGAVDDVTKEGEAVALPYDRMVNSFDLPEEFRKFTIRFMDDDKTVWSKDFVYDDRLGEDEYPVITGAEGEYAYWEDKKVSPIVRNVTVHSVRRVYVPAIASRPDSDENRSLLVMEGDFYPDSTLLAFLVGNEEMESLNAAKQKYVPGSRYMISRAYRYKITQSREFNPFVRIRALNALVPANKILLLDKDLNPVGQSEGASGSGEAVSGVTGALDAVTVGSYADAKAQIADEGYIILIVFVSRGNMAAIILVIIIAIGIFGSAAYRVRKQRRKRLAGAMSAADEPEESDEDVDESDDFEDGDSGTDDYEDTDPEDPDSLTEDFEDDFETDDTEDDDLQES